MKKNSDVRCGNREDEIPDSCENDQFITANDGQIKKTDKMMVVGEMDNFPKDRGWAWIILLGKIYDDVFDWPKVRKLIQTVDHGCLITQTQLCSNFKVTTCILQK